MSFFIFYFLLLVDTEPKTTARTCCGVLTHCCYICSFISRLFACSLIVPTLNSCFIVKTWDSTDLLLSALYNIRAITPRQHGTLLHVFYFHYYWCVYTILELMSSIEADELFARRLQAQELGIRSVPTSETPLMEENRNPTVINARFNEISSSRATVIAISALHIPQVWWYFCMYLI